MHEIIFYMTSIIIPLNSVVTYCLEVLVYDDMKEIISFRPRSSTAMFVVIITGSFKLPMTLEFFTKLPQS